MEALQRRMKKTSRWIVSAIGLQMLESNLFRCVRKFSGVKMYIQKVYSKSVFKLNTLYVLTSIF